MHSPSLSSHGDAIVRIMCAIAVRAAMTELAAMFEAETGGRLQLVYDTNPAIARRIENGEPFDMTIINPHLLDELVSAGLVEPTSRLSFGRSPMGIAMRATAPPIDVTTQAAFARLMLDAKSIGYSFDGTSGRRFLQILERLDILASVRSKLMPLPGGMAGTAIAVGEVEIAITPITTIIAAAPEVRIGGLLPISAETEIEFDIAIGSLVQNRPVAEAFFQFLTSPSIDALIAANGLQRTAAVPSI